jgi:protein gp37
MGSNSKIEWTRHTFNAWVGCSKVSAGCTRCYAESLAKRTGLAIWGDSGTRHVTSDAYWQEHVWREASRILQFASGCVRGSTGPFRAPSSTLAIDSRHTSFA